MCKHVAGKIVKQYSSIQCHSVARHTLVPGPSITLGHYISVNPINNLLSAVHCMIYTNALHFIYKHVLNFTQDTPMSLDLHPQNT